MKTGVVRQVTALAQRLQIGRLIVRHVMIEVGDSENDAERVLWLYQVIPILWQLVKLALSVTPANGVICHTATLAAVASTLEDA